MDYSKTPLSLSPTAYWRLGDASGSPQDISGGGRHLSVTGTPVYGEPGWAGDGGKLMRFPGSTRLTYTDNAAWDMGTGDYSLAWVYKRNGNPSDSEYIIAHGVGGDTGAWQVHTWQEDAFDLYHGATGYRLWHSGGDMFDNQLHHCVLTFDRDGVCQFYLDGATYGSISIATSSSMDLTNGSNLEVGWGWSTYYLQATLGELMIFKGKLLTADEVKTLYTARYRSLMKPDADTDAGGWTTTPLWSKVDEDPSSPDSTVITATTA